jgi:UDP-GlcNAc:undecaprenyl-phosphate GlcNAc-1-phosphate transferase
MGDAGSLFLGFLLAAISLKLRFAVGPPASIVAILLLMGPPIFDTTLVVVSRWREGRSIYLGGTDHTAHRLLQLGVPTRLVAGLLAIGAAACAGLGVAVGRGAVPAWGALLAAVTVGTGLLVGLLSISAESNAREVMGVLAAQSEL